ncbi:MAG: hypothetical protein MJ252_10475 [archaeon]|nr:hypothetical protein [archaeon]
MNNLQKSYDSYDKTNVHLKMIENRYHKRNLYLIRKRKPLYNSPPRKGIPHNTSNDLSKYLKIIL